MAAFISVSNRRSSSGFGSFANLSVAIFDFSIRLWIAKVFFLSGLSKIQSWQSTVMLFEYEYQVPVLPPLLAAQVATATELILPVFIVLGLAARFASLSLFVFNAVAVYAYSSFLFGDEGAAGLQQHILWGMMMLVTVFHGAGKFSLDHLIARWKKGTSIM
uniref:Putative oxidoreductase n=1 Tax=Candidatus Kentrum sp. LFY TaxID=2126342 RepID=A0A450WWV7_9GAMM|nr:MAG: putative oxidoreductase [Candidatus Kentron sp. LFY]VFK00510.1 MAG: putative oxidoreductase [Candidatus Kentron sp. LFY]VFK21565.1 MAG: putative oxidoreductase [Candidatus Kentron sp. LFY]